MANQYLPPVIAIPSALEISNITQGAQMVVSTMANTDQMNTYIVGQLVRLTVPYSFGMFQANGLQGQIVDINGSDMTLSINSTDFDPFVTVQGQVASLAPAGSRNLQFNNTTGTIPFQSLNNQGN
jgi:hypothetical protein